MKRILGLVLVGLILMGLAATASWAYFSDTESSSGNHFTAGSLDLVPSNSATGPAGKYTVNSMSNGVTGYVTFTNLVPGESGSMAWTMQNNGTVNGTLTMPSAVTFTENGSNEPEAAVAGNNGGGNGDLDTYLGVRVKRGSTYFLGSATNYVPASGLKAALDAQSQALAASGTLTYTLEWALASDIKGAGVDGLFGTADDVDVVDNIIQSDTVQIDITFTLTQS